MTTSDVRTQILHLPAEATMEELRPVARNLALVASRRDHALKSIAAFQRHNTQLPHLVSVVALAREELALGHPQARRDGPSESPMPPMRWLSVDATAALLPGTSATTVKERLRTREGRYALGWAWWDGYRWLIPQPAIDPAARAAYMATLPEVEPSAHVASLPAWACV